MELFILPFSSSPTLLYSSALRCKLPVGDTIWQKKNFMFLSLIIIELGHVPDMFDTAPP